MLKVVIIGYGEMFANMIAGTLDSGSKIVGVFRHDRIKYPRPIRWIKDIINPDTDYNYIKSYKLHEIKATSANSESFRKQLLKLNPDIMIVASWSEKLDKKTFDMPKTATINIHPSLIPSFCGKGHYGLHVHEAALGRGVKVTGATVHFVDDGTDTGPIILQKPVMIEQDDTPETLQRRVMEQAEWVILPQAIDLIAQGKVKVIDGKTVIEQ